MKRARGQEVIRQWKLLKETEAARYGLTVEQLAERLGVTSRTIRRDLAQLQEAGFPLEQRQRDTGAPGASIGRRSRAWWTRG